MTTPDEYTPEDAPESEEYVAGWADPSLLEADPVDRVEQTVEVEVVEDFLDEAER